MSTESELYNLGFDLLESCNQYIAYSKCYNNITCYYILNYINTELHTNEDFILVTEQNNGNIEDLEYIINSNLKMLNKINKYYEEL